MDTGRIPTQEPLSAQAQDFSIPALSRQAGQVTLSPGFLAQLMGMNAKVAVAEHQTATMEALREELRLMGYPIQGREPEGYNGPLPRQSRRPKAMGEDGPKRPSVTWQQVGWILGSFALGMGSAAAWMVGVGR